MGKQIVSGDLHGAPAEGPSQLLHELSQPLTAIASYSSAAVRLAQAAPPADARLGQAVAGIAEQIARVAEVLERLRAAVAEAEPPQPSPPKLPRTPSPQGRGPMLDGEATERFASSVLEQVAETIVVCDAQGRVVRASNSAMALCGRDPRGSPFGAEFPLTLAAPGSGPSGDLAQEALGGAVLRAVRATLTRVGSAPVELMVSAAPVTTGARQLAGCVITMTDITEIRRAEARLRQSEDRFRVALQDSPVTVATLDRQLRYTWVHNTRHGFSPERVLGRRPDELIPAADAAELTAFLKHVLETGQRERREISGQTDGVRWSYYDTAEPMRDERGEIVGLTLTMIDATERRAAEDALRDADARRNEFLARLSHELRNPLTPIRNSLCVLGRAAPGSEQARRATTVIERQVGQLARLVDDLLDVTRITRSGVQLQRQRLELAPLLARAAEDHDSLFSSSGVALNVRAAPQPLWVVGDPVRLTQAIGNLLQNAARHTVTGDQVTLELTEDKASRTAVIRVRDTGAGIAPEVLPRLFEPYTQGGSALDRRDGGLGLGLALVRGLVELHGGTVTAASAGLGAGAQFEVRLPLSLAEAATAHQRRLLIIDDNVDVAESLREALAFGGHHLEVAHTGPEGLALARRFHPEVVLCDLGLPEMDGYAVARAFRADQDLAHAYLVALSGYARPDDLARAEAAGFNRHLAKPATVDKLEALLHQLPAPVTP
jgi:two-component system CheB/CheR fusion protein